jgi:DNA-binding SARP family transcriptional activator
LRPVEFGILGPLQVVAGERPVILGAAKLRATLAVLLVHANQFTSLDRLVDELWEDRPPNSAAKLVPQYVSQLRRSLQPDWGRRCHAGSLLETRPRGYLLHVEADALDADRFRALVERSRCLVRSNAAQAAADGLRQALGLWRGVALADVPRTPSVTAAAVQLEELRIAAAEDRIEAELAVGRHSELVCELSALVSRHPLQERLRGQLMLALYRSGRQAEALQAYQAARQVLLEELGIEPGRALRQLQQAILTADLALEPASDRVRDAAASSAQLPPAQLPADVADFTGRGRHLRRLHQLLAASQHTTAVTISAIVGAAGTGKTTLALHWAHQVRHRFGDGQLYVDLRGTTLTVPLRPIQALSNLLRGLGVAAADVPDELDQAAALYRTLLADRQVLVVLDDARDADQLRPLLPGSRGCLVLVTSRDQLAELVARQGARRLTLDLLTPTEAKTLLDRVLGDQRIRSEPTATAELVRACGGLPLALRTAAAELAGQPRRSIASYVDHLGQATPSLPA